MEYTSFMRAMAFFKIDCVMRWSATVWLKSAFSASLTSPARLICFFISAMLSCSALMSSVSLDMVCSRSAILVSKSAFLSLAAAVERSFTPSSSVHQSLCTTSSACCFESSATSLSITSLTFVKASSLALPARRASFGSVLFAAAFCKTATARCLIFISAAWLDVAEICTKAAFTVLSKLSNASSALRILMVSSTAAISSRRSFTRLSNSSEDMAHFSLRFLRNSVSKPSWSWTFWSSLASIAYFSSAFA
mmetsp:Transcript_22497/g.52314  ORF Transcript_22497/g.52314 Transcript_22497/m.52314 type:complete len:250 (+) Transcript_22497:524-1273(+)